jgi:hypothetical protein
MLVLASPFVAYIVIRHFFGNGAVVAAWIGAVLALAICVMLVEWILRAAYWLWQLLGGKLDA